VSLGEQIRFIPSLNWASKLPAEGNPTMALRRERFPLL
jgi:hypothetical protein